METIRILFLGGAKRNSLAEEFILDSKKYQKKCMIYSYELDYRVPIAQVGLPIIGKKWSDPTIIDHLLEVINNYDINIVLPFVDPSIEICGRLKNINQKVFIITPPINIIHTFYNKKKTNEWCIQNRIKVPKNYSFKSISYPSILKPIYGSASKGIYFIRDKTDWEYYSKKILTEDYIIQEFINGQEFTVDCYVSKNGKITGITPRIRLQTLGGESVKTQTKKNHSIVLIVKEIINKAGLIGPLTFQFIIDKTGNIYLLEINTRFGGGCLTSINAGARYSEYLIRDYLGFSMPDKIHWKDGFLMTRTFREVYFDTDN